MRLSVRGAGLLASALVLASCAGLLGVEEVAYRATDAGAGDDGSPDDGSHGDGSPDAPPPACPADPFPACDGGLARCTANAPCDIDLTHDPNNCGECGRLCDSTCAGGLCTLTQVDVSNDPGIDVPGTRPVWATDNIVIWIVGSQASAILMDPRGNQTGGTTVSGSDTVQADIAVDGTVVFSLNTYGIDENPFDGGGPLRSFAIPAQPGPPARMTYDGARLYYTDGVTGGTVVAIDRDDGGVTALAQGQLLPSHILLVDGGLAFVNQAGPSAGNGAIVAAFFADAPGTTHQKVGPLTTIGGLVSAGAGVAYYSLVERGEIWRLDTTTFQTSMFAAGLNEVRTLAVDDTFVLFDGRPNALSPYGIYRARRCDGTIAQVWAAPTDDAGAPVGLVDGIVAHGRFVYWSLLGVLFRTRY